MNKLAGIAAIAVSTATLAVVVLSGGAASASGGGSSGTWPAAFPLPTTPGTLLSQSSITAVVRSTDSVEVVDRKLDDMYVTKKGCTLRLAVNKPKDYICPDPASKKSREIYFTFAALDPKATDPSVSQTNAFLVKG
jgi:hypothetical protein